MGISSFSSQRVESRRMVQGGRGSKVNSPRSFSTEPSRRWRPPYALIKERVTALGHKPLIELAGVYPQAEWYREAFRLCMDEGFFYTKKVGQ